MKFGRIWVVAALLITCLAAWGQEKRKIIIDQDAAGPAGTDQQSILLLIQSPQTDVLGVTVVTGDAWLKSEVAHTLRMLELIGRPIFRSWPGPSTRWSAERTKPNSGSSATAPFPGWAPGLRGFIIPLTSWENMPEGKPTTKAIDEDAAHFLVRMVHKYPHEVTIYAGGPMTNLALAISIDPEFPQLAKELVFMGASFNPQTADPEFINTPRHEFNIWFDPEAAHIVLRAPWKKIVCTPVDISVKTRMTKN